MIIRATVEIEFEVKEGADLTDAYVVSRATLFGKEGTHLGDSYDCETSDVEVRFIQRQPRFFREDTGDYLFDTGLTDPCGNRVCRFAAVANVTTSITESMVHESHFRDHCTEVSRADVPAVWLRFLLPEAK